jgi:hypothetical protein
MTNYFTCKCKMATTNVSYPSISKDKQEGVVVLTGKCSTVMSCIMNIIKILFWITCKKIIIIKFLFEDQISGTIFGTSSYLSSPSPHLFPPLLLSSFMGSLHPGFCFLGLVAPLCCQSHRATKSTTLPFMQPPK